GVSPFCFCRITRRTRRCLAPGLGTEPDADLFRLYYELQLAECPVHEPVPQRRSRHHHADRHGSVDCRFHQQPDSMFPKLHEPADDLPAEMQRTAMMPRGLAFIAALLY